MKYYQKVLFPTDFSKYSDAAYDFAIKFSYLFKAELHIFYYHSNIVYKNAFRSEFLFSEYNQKSNNKYPIELEYYMKKYVPKYGLGEDRIIRICSKGYSPATSIIDYINSKGIDFVFLGIHYSHGLKNIIVHHIEKEVIKSVPCNILIINNKSIINTDVKSILIALDFSKCSRKLLLEGSYIAEKFNAELTLLHVIQEPIPVFINYDIPDQYFCNFYENAEDNAKKKLDKIANESNIQKNYKIKVIKGNVPNSIANYAKSKNYDLIIIGVNSKKRRSKMFFGNVSDKLLNSPTCPLLLIK